MKRCQQMSLHTEVSGVCAQFLNVEFELSFPSALLLSRCSGRAAAAAAAAAPTAAATAPAATTAAAATAITVAVTVT
eukprot:COSAG02_NODE_23307_length_722_cov_1.902087_2_plen_76_part_01